MLVISCFSLFYDKTLSIYNLLTDEATDLSYSIEQIVTMSHHHIYYHLIHQLLYIFLEYYLKGICLVQQQYLIF